MGVSSRPARGGGESAAAAAVPGAAVAAAAGGVLLLVVFPEKGGNGEIYLADGGVRPGQSGQGEAGAQGKTGSAPGAPGAGAAAAVAGTTHRSSTPNSKVVRDGCPSQSSIRSAGRRGEKKNGASDLLAPSGSGRRIRTLTYRVRVCCATLTQSRYLIGRARKRRCYYSKPAENVKRKNQKNKKILGRGLPGPELGGQWRSRSPHLSWGCS